MKVKVAEASGRVLGVRDSGLEHAHDVFFTHDQDFLAIDLDGLAGVLAEQDAIADLHIQLADVALLKDPAVADGQHFALIGLLAGRVGDDDTAGGGALGFNALDDHAIMQWTDFHVAISYWFRSGPEAR